MYAIQMEATKNSMETEFMISDATLGDSNLLNHERLLHIFVFFHWVSHMSWTFLAFPPEMPEPQSVTDFLLTPGRAAAVMARVIVLLYCHCNRLPSSYYHWPDDSKLLNDSHPTHPRHTTVLHMSAQNLKPVLFQDRQASHLIRCAKI